MFNDFNAYEFSGGAGGIPLKSWKNHHFLTARAAFRRCTRKLNSFIKNINIVEEIIMKRDNKIKISDLPSDLSHTSKALWRDVLGNRINAKERMVLLHRALITLDQTEEAATIIKNQGMIVAPESTRTHHLHPCLKVERENRALFARIWSQMLCLNWDQ